MIPDEVMGEVPKPRGWSRLAPWIAGLGVAMVFILLGTIVFQQWHYDNVQRGYHKETITILTEHTDTLNEIHQLRAEVTKLVKQYGPDLTQGQEQIVAEYTWIACSLESGPSKCGAVPTP